jgi:hypothetical protein
MSTPNDRRLRICCAACQRGIVLFIALIALVVLSLATTAIVRSMDTTTALTGNIALRHAAFAAADSGVEAAAALLAEPAFVGDTDVPIRGYYASKQGEEDARGIPWLLQQTTRYPDGAPILDGGNGQRVRFVVERLCAASGVATATHCNMVTPHTASAPGKAEPPSYAAFRVTVRVDGPASTLAYVQAMVVGTAPLQRASWRVIGE